MSPRTLVATCITLALFSPVFAADAPLPRHPAPSPDGTQIAFSWAFQTLDRGPLVGSPTFGAVISTGGTQLINGGWVRLPGRGWFVAGSGINMERNGAQPDVVVWQPPAEDSSATDDTQLFTAVRVRLDGIEDDPRYGAW